MLPGQFVVYQGDTYQLVRQITTAISGPGGIPVPATLFDLAAGSSSRSVTVPNRRPYWWTDAQWATTSEPSLLPGCQTCGASAGYPCDTACNWGTFSSARLITTRTPA